ncbi:phage tail assembly chaperone G [Jeotgalibacillus salarius]|uniref:Phage protein n=1 Tax=Jeotgalibacillus salarius TaxID=546023 RepID=A0A4Y8LIY2_9BACL|nr:hypothetical protein [Jeotgalibacillus salarius]TFE02888.1 hypothetical protein E2626_03525 [Jeotgalibacillus salarius]
MEIILKNLVTTDNDNGEKEVKVEEKTYHLPYPPMGAYLDYLVISKRIEKITTDNVKEYVGLIVRTFQHQFTEEEFINGVAPYEIFKVIGQFVNDLTKDPYAELKPKDEEGNGKKEKK